MKLLAFSLLRVVAAYTLLLFFDAKADCVPMVMLAIFTHMLFQFWVRGNVNIKEKIDMQRIAKIMPPWLYSTISAMNLLVILMFTIQAVS